MEIPNHIAAIKSDGGAEHPLGFPVKIKAAREELSRVSYAEAERCDPVRAGPRLARYRYRPWSTKVFRI
jgi:hypothetical protein